MQVIGLRYILTFFYVHRILYEHIRWIEKDHYQPELQLERPSISSLGTFA